MTCPIVVQGEDLAVGERNSSNALSITILSVCVFVDVVTQVQDIVYRVFPGRVAVRVEEAKGEVAAGVNRKIHASDVVLSCRCRLCPAKRARDVRFAHGELVVITGVGLQSYGFNLSHCQTWDKSKSMDSVL